MEKFKILCRENKTALISLAVLDLVEIALYVWAQHIDNTVSYWFAPGTPARLVANLVLINAVVLAMVAGGRYRRAKHTDDDTQTAIYNGDDLSLHVVGFTSDTMPKYVQPGMPDFLPNLVGANYERGNLERLSVVFENHLGAPVETDDSYRLERKVSRKWYAVEECEGYEPHWSKIEIPTGTSGKIAFPVWGRYITLGEGYYRIVKPVTVRGETVYLAGEFLLR